MTFTTIMKYHQIFYLESCFLCTLLIFLSDKCVLHMKHMQLSENIILILEGFKTCSANDAIEHVIYTFPTCILSLIVFECSENIYRLPKSI